MARAVARLAPEVSDYVKALNRAKAAEAKKAFAAALNILPRGAKDFPSLAGVQDGHRKGGSQILMEGLAAAAWAVARAGFSYAVFAAFGGLCAFCALALEGGGGGNSRPSPSPVLADFFADASAREIELSPAGAVRRRILYAHRGRALQVARKLYGGGSRSPLFCALFWAARNPFESLARRHLGAL